MSQPDTASRRLVALSTTSVFPDRTPDAFEMAARLGYDGLEVMVTPDAVSQDVTVLRQLMDYHGLPVLAVHAPCLLLTQRVWGWDPWGKLVRAKDVAEQLGARVVVVHPPFRWQREYARDFEAGLARMRDETDVVFAVENMFPIRARGAEVAPYAPSWNPVPMDYPHVTLDLSHTAVSGSDALAMAGELGSRLAHVHLADGTGLPYKDEHLVPGRGTQPCAPLLRQLVAADYPGVIVLEVKTFRATTPEARQADLAEALEFTRAHLAEPGTADAGSTPGLGQPGQREPSAAQSSATQPGTAQPGATRPDTAQPGATRSGTARPSTAQPSTAQPSTAQPNTAQPGGAPAANGQPGPVQDPAPACPYGPDAVGPRSRV